MFSFSSSYTSSVPPPSPASPPLRGAAPIGDPIVLVTNPAERAMRIAATVAGLVHFSVTGGRTPAGVGITFVSVDIAIHGRRALRARARDWRGSARSCSFACIPAPPRAALCRAFSKRFFPALGLKTRGGRGNRFKNRFSQKRPDRIRRSSEDFSIVDERSVGRGVGSAARREGERAANGKSLRWHTSPLCD
jgi:hypothetical protein